VIVAESTSSRRLVGRLDPGTDLLQQLTEVCRSHRVHAGEVRIVGTLDDVVLSQRRLAGALDIITFACQVGGTAGAPTLAAWVTLGRARDEGRELLGGRITGARVVTCDFVIDAFDDLRTATGTPHAEKPAEKPVPSFDAPARTTWSDVAAASARRVEAEAARAETAAPPPALEAEASPDLTAVHHEVHVQAGDYIDHPKFGRCQVERVDGDGEFVSARLRNQRLIRLSLEVLTLIPAGQENGKNLFRAVAGK